MDDISFDKLSGYDQKAFIQARLHEIMLRIDRLNVNPLIFNTDFQCYNYEIIFRDLMSAFATISSKLNESDKQVMINLKDEIKSFLKEKSPHKVGKFSGGSGVYFSSENYNTLLDKLFTFRLKLEELMDKHGFNPAKDDPRRAVVGE